MTNQCAYVALAQIRTCRWPHADRYSLAVHRSTPKRLVHLAGRAERDVPLQAKAAFRRKRRAFPPCLNGRGWRRALAPLILVVWVPTLQSRLSARKGAERNQGAILLGAKASYDGCGFDTEPTGELCMPGRNVRDRFVALGLRLAVLDGARGQSGASGKLQPRADPNSLSSAGDDNRRAVAKPAA
jgi:hypothetical protein